MGFNLGNALKYIWRCDLKKDAVEDLRKARWYIDEEIKKRTEIVLPKPPQPGSSYNMNCGTTNARIWDINEECGK
jgi:hypothetical protein